MVSTSSPAATGGLSRRHALLLESYGRTIMQDVLSVIFEGLLFSAYGVFFIVALYSIIRRGLKSPRNIIMLIVVVSLFGVALTQWVVDVFSVFKEIQYLLMATDIPLHHRRKLADEVFENFFPLQDTLFDISLIIADAVLIWRTWAIYQGRIAAIVAPCFLLLSAFVFALIDMTCFLDYGPLPGGDQICPQASVTMWALSVGTNVACTLLVGFKAWQHRKMMKQLNIGGKSHRMSTEHIMSLLVDSGFIYSLLLLGQVICYIYVDPGPDSPWWYISEIFKETGQQIIGIYPTLIIVIVNFKRTLWDEYPVTPANSAALNSSKWMIHVNRDVEQSTFDSGSEVGSQPRTISRPERKDFGFQPRHASNTSVTEC
ncbi:hypothetical protein MSAN_01205000 [Mycena sanguinolenta]|uniref:Uncharacterized protein n=1 Tax=Mycena sanguinolenta TaxID=230812 RepID=A0A8H7D4I1_9AGAR|nr:hypothetical protein MSAN_01205000 [Mycena sanguinolenta]